MGNNNRVRYFRTIWVLALVAMLVTAFVPQAVASWVCEGRTCGIALWFCCCSAPEDSQDPNCASAPRAVADGVSNCPANCNCVLTVTNADGSRPSYAATFVAPLYAPALVVPKVSYHGPVPTELLAHSIESRGPPRASICLATPALRGPPCLNASLIGS